MRYKSMTHMEVVATYDLPHRIILYYCAQLLKLSVSKMSKNPSARYVSKAIDAAENPDKYSLDDIEYLENQLLTYFNKDVLGANDYHPVISWWKHTSITGEEATQVMQEVLENRLTELEKSIILD